MNYHEDDFPKIIDKIRSHQGEFEIKLMDDVTHLPFGGGRKFTLFGIKPGDGFDNTAWGATLRFCARTADSPAEVVQLRARS